MLRGPIKERIVVSWHSPPFESLNFNVDGAAREKPCPTSTGGVLYNNRGEFCSHSLSILGSRI